MMAIRYNHGKAATMAKISANGTTIGTIDFAAKAKRYMSNGKVLINHGTGWKVHGTVKAGVTPAEAFERAAAKQGLFLAERPALAAYRKAMLEIGGLASRAKLAVILRYMADDPDGVWSEARDGYGDNVHLDVDEVAEICRLYLSAEAEAKALNVPVAAE